MFDEIEFWTGSGSSRAALLIDWVENSADPPALAWGYRWDGTAHGSDMLAAIVAADPRLFAKLGGSAANPNAVFGLGYDTNRDGQFALDDGTVFDAFGIAITAPADLATALDPADTYSEGWFTGFWHYGVEMPAGANPYDGGNWVDASAGMADRELIDGSWDSWVFSPTFNFASFADNPRAAMPPFPPGDFNRDGRADAADYAVWRASFGSSSHLDADANGNGTIDAADYVIWRKRFAAESLTQSVAGAQNVPEPQTIQLVHGTGILLIFTLVHRNRRWTRINADLLKFDRRSK